MKRKMEWNGWMDENTIRVLLRGDEEPVSNVHLRLNLVVLS